VTQAQTAADFDAPERDLWTSLRTDRSKLARERLFDSYSKFAAGVAWRYFRRYSYGDIDIADVRQLGFAGLLEAIDRFDPGKGVPFKAFAAYRITGCIRDGVAHMTEMREQISWRQRMRRERIKSLEGDRPVPSGSADTLTALADVAIGLALGFMLEDTGMIAIEDDPSPALATAYESPEWRQLVGRLEAGLSLLPDREALILKYHYIDGLSFDQVASLLVLSNARISQLHKAALTTLRKRLAAAGHFRLEK
jgi:RNA polymerase sigma factor FliA